MRTRDTQQSTSARVGTMLTRRGLFRATAATGGVVAAVRLLSGCVHGGDETATDPVIVDKDKAVYVIDPETNENNFSLVDLSLAKDASYELPVGTVLRPSEGTWIAATSVGTTTNPVVVGSAVSMSSGTLSNVVTSLLTSSEPSYAIFDVRCSDAAYAWVEMNLLTKAWTLYGSAFSDGALTGKPTKLWEADADWDPPRMTVTGTTVIWQVMPAISGTKTAESSRCYLWSVGSSDAQAVVESPGRFATAPAVSGSTVTLSPRVRADKGVFYGITAYSLDDAMASVVDQLVLPQAISPMCAVRIGDKFVFSVEASYSDGGLLASMGTYIGTSKGDFVVLSREPVAEVAGREDLYIVKSRSSYFVINTAKEQYALLGAADRAVDYGDFPAREGLCTSFVTFATTKNPTTGHPASVAVRSFTL